MSGSPRFWFWVFIWKSHTGLDGVANSEIWDLSGDLDLIWDRSPKLKIWHRTWTSSRVCHNSFSNSDPFSKNYISQGHSTVYGDEFGRIQANSIEKFDWIRWPVFDPSEFYRIQWLFSAEFAWILQNSAKPCLYRVTLSLGRKFRFTSKIPLPMIVEILLKNVSVARNTSVASYVHNRYYILCAKYVGSISIEIEDMDTRVLFIQSTRALFYKYVGRFSTA